MDYIGKIPLLLSLAAALLIGSVGHATGVPNRDVLLNMLIGLIIFFIVGILIRNTIKTIMESLLEKTLLKQEEEKKQEQERQAEELAKEKEKGQQLDLRADDPLEPIFKDNDFDPLPVAEFIKNELR